MMFLFCYYPNQWLATNTSVVFFRSDHLCSSLKSYLTVYINCEERVITFFAKTLDFFASLLYHGEVLKRSIMNINRLRYRRGKREWNGCSCLCVSHDWSEFASC